MLASDISASTFRPGSGVGVWHRPADPNTQTPRFVVCASMCTHDVAKLGKRVRCDTHMFLGENVIGAGALIVVAHIIARVRQIAMARLCQRPEFRSACDSYIISDMADV